MVFHESPSSPVDLDDQEQINRVFERFVHGLASRLYSVIIATWWAFRFKCMVGAFEWLSF